jgi:tetratricopeptide (TPR) repeat protein
MQRFKLLLMVLLFGVAFPLNAQGVTCDSVLPEDADAAAYAQRGESCLDAANDSRASEDYSIAIERDPMQAGYYIGRGRAYCRSADYLYSGSYPYHGGYAEAALADFDTALTLELDSVAVYYWRGICNALIGEYLDALDDLNHAVFFDPGFEEAYLELAQVWLALGEPQIALSVLDRLADKLDESTNLGIFEQAAALRIDAESYTAISDDGSHCIGYTSGRVNIRREPDEFSDVINVVRRANQPVEVWQLIDLGVFGIDNQDWFWVQYANTNGFIRADLLRLAETERCDNLSVGD